MTNLNPRKNFEETAHKIGYISRKNAKQEDYDRVGFMSGLEVHQQILTKRKLFCRCPAGIFQTKDQYDAEIVRHMRPTLSELGEYDGTALMEFKTKKEIVYRIVNKTACTYEVDDTPPFHIDHEALEKAIEIALACKLNIVGEVHVTRKQYLDGSIPTGFQRTAIIGVEGAIRLKDKNIRLIQLSLEEDSCREVSDIGHRRIYRTDRLGMPLIETVTYPDFKNPDEVKAGCDYIRFLNRSTGKVRTGIGAGRQDVNVSCKGGTRVEIKGVAHTKWIAELTHVEVFRQWALLAIREELLKRCQFENWEMKARELKPKDFKFYYTPLNQALAQGNKLYAVNLPYFKGLLSHFTQPGKAFYDEFTNRLKVIACIEKPNMATSEDLDDVVSSHVFEQIQDVLQAGENDAQILFWAPEADVKTALDTIEERAKMAFEGVPKETRKSFVDGTTIFERVLPGADRMYPDTDSAPIPLENAYIESLSEKISEEIADRYDQLQKWEIPEDTYTYIFSNNLYPYIKNCVENLQITPKRVGVLFGQKLKHLHGQHKFITFNLNKIYEILSYLDENKKDMAIMPKLLDLLFVKPDISLEEIKDLIGYNSPAQDMIKDMLKKHSESFKNKRKDTTKQDKINYLMGIVRPLCEGFYNLKEVSSWI